MIDGDGMNTMILGAAGFIGTNLALYLAGNGKHTLTLVDEQRVYFHAIESMNLPAVHVKECPFNDRTDFDALLEKQELVYHLASTTVPTTSNQQIVDELTANVVTTARMLESCVKCGVKKVVFISSGGTVYGKDAPCPLQEDTPTYPISSYGIQKVTIEKLLYLYRYMYGLDYRVIRLANPYGPYQRPNGLLGAVTTFTHKALRGEEIVVYGDGSVVRDFIYIDDAIRAMQRIVEGSSEHRTFNLGCGYGTSIREVLETIREALGIDLHITYRPGRQVDVPVNYLDIGRYERAYGKLNPISLHDGIVKTAAFMRAREQTAITTREEA